MEKRTPHYRLSEVKPRVKEERVRSTLSALSGAASLGIDFKGMPEVVSKLVRADFHKSMTTRSDHKVWQDVYRPDTLAGNVNLKLTIDNDLLIVSFKELWR